MLLPLHSRFIRDEIHARVTSLSLLSKDFNLLWLWSMSFLRFSFFFAVPSISVHVLYSSPSLCILSITFLYNYHSIVQSRKVTEKKRKCREQHAKKEILASKIEVNCKIAFLPYNSSRSSFFKSIVEVIRFPFVLLRQSSLFWLIVLVDVKPQKPTDKEYLTVIWFIGHMYFTLLLSLWKRETRGYLTRIFLVLICIVKGKKKPVLQNKHVADVMVSASGIQEPLRQTL